MRLEHGAMALILLAGLLVGNTVPAGAQIPTATPRQTGVTAPFTFTVPVQLTTLHLDVKRIAVECRVGGPGTLASAAGHGMDDSTLVAYGLTVLDAAAVTDSTGSYTGDVTVRSFNRGTSDVTLGVGYECSLYLSNQMTGGVSSDGILQYPCAPDPTGGCGYNFRLAGSMAAAWSARDTTVVRQNIHASGSIPHQ